MLLLKLETQKTRYIGSIFDLIKLERMLVEDKIDMSYNININVGIVRDDRGVKIVPIRSGFEHLEQLQQF